MNIFVTGCAGFIGWSVCELLLNEGHTVVGIDNLNDAYDPRLKMWRVSQLERFDEFQWYTVDVTDRKSLAERFELGGFDVVVNLAARAGVRESQKDPWIYNETNNTGTLNLLDQCQKHEIRKFVLASSSSVYGNEQIPFSELAPANSPLSPYAASKKAAEQVSYSYHHMYGISVAALRFFTVYGPAGRPDMSMFRFIRWVSEGQELSLFGDGSQTRSFTYVNDIAQGVLASIHRPLSFEVINLGSDSTIRLCDVISKIEKRVGRVAKIVKLPSHPLDAQSTHADISKARNLLGWEPLVSIDEGIDKSVAWYEQNRSWASELRLN